MSTQKIPSNPDWQDGFLKEMAREFVLKEKIRLGEGSLGIFWMYTGRNECRVEFRRANKRINDKLGANIWEQSTWAGKTGPQAERNHAGSSRKLSDSKVLKEKREKLSG